MKKINAFETWHYDKKLEISTVKARLDLLHKWAM